MTISMVKVMEDKITDKTVPYIVFESTVSRFDRVFKRMWILVFVLIVLLLGTNLAWLYYECQFEDDVITTTTVEQKIKSDKGDANINDGVHINGDSDTESNKNDKTD